MGNFARIQLLGTSRSDKDLAGTKRYKLTRKDEHGNPVQLTKFADREEQVEAMMVLDEEGRCAYDHDPVYRETVNDITANSVFTEPTLARRNPIPTNEEFLAALKVDALRQRRAELTEQAGGSDAIAKYNAALSLTDPANYEDAMAMQEATEQPRPYEDMLKSRKAEGLGALQWTFAVDADKAISPAEDAVAGADADGHIIQIEGE